MTMMEARILEGGVSDAPARGWERGTRACDKKLPTGGGRLKIGIRYATNIPARWCVARGHNKKHGELLVNELLRLRSCTAQLHLRRLRARRCWMWIDTVSVGGRVRATLPVDALEEEGEDDEPDGQQDNVIDQRGDD